MGFRSPAARASYEQEIKKSRFIGITAPVRSPGEAEAVIASVRTELAGATHHCWAYVIGDPDSNPRMRMDDAGEPAGTAGKPILGVLQKRRVGDALVVVVRYFGGVKLGASGLARAYSSTASRVLDAARLVEREPLVEARCHVDYADEALARRLMDEHGIEIVSADYGEDVALRMSLPEAELERFARALSDRTSGRARWYSGRFSKEQI